MLGYVAEREGKMGKSKIPKRFKASEKAHTATNTEVKAASAKFGKLAKAFADGSTIARNLPKNYKSVYDAQSNEMVAYFEIVSMILEYEDQLDATDDKKEISKLKKKIVAEEKKAEARVKALQELRKTYAMLRKLAADQLAAAQAIYDGLNHDL